MRYLLMIVFASFMAACSSSSKQEGKNGKGDTPPMQIEYLLADIDTSSSLLNVTGSILANESLDLHTEVSGRITSINFKEGEYVAQGAVLLTLNNEDLKAQLKKLDLNISLATKNEDRQKQMLAIKAISQEEYDAGLNALNTLLAERELLQANINKTIIRAPFSGVVGLRQVSVGSIVSPSTVIAGLTQLNPIKIEFAISDKYASKIKKGDRLKFSIDNNPNKKYDATIFALDNEVNVANRSITVRAYANNTQGKFLPGTYASVQLPIVGTSQTIVVPTEVVIPELNKQKVFVVVNGRVKSRVVQLGQRFSTGVEIIDGLHSGDTIVATGILQLKDSMMVVPKNLYK